MWPTGLLGRATRRDDRCGWNSSPSSLGGTDRSPQIPGPREPMAARTIPTLPGRGIVLAAVPRLWPDNPRTAISRARFPDRWSNPPGRGSIRRVISPSRQPAFPCLSHPFSNAQSGAIRDSRGTIKKRESRPSGTSRVAPASERPCGPSCRKTPANALYRPTTAAGICGRRIPMA